jgi:glycosyltransferase involved in cell wall biosynthesis
MEPQTLSVVMPNFNHGRFLDQSLTAILEQSFRPLEVAVVDDGSSDDSVEIVSRLCRQHPALRLLRNRRNRGVCYSIKRGLQACTGEYVYCTSADDLILPGFFEKSMRLLARHPQAGLSFAHCSTLDGVTGEVEENRFDWGDSPRYFSPQALAKILNGDIIPGHTAILRRAALVGARGVIPELQWHWDWFANLVVAFREGACFIPETVALLRTSTGSFGESGRRSAQQQQVIDRLLYLLASPVYADVLSHFQESGALRHFAPEVLRVAIRNHDHWEPNRIRLIAQVVYQECALLLRDKDPEIRQGVCLFAGALGRRIGDVVAVLLGALEDKERLVRFAAADALGKINGDGRIVVQPLTRILRAILLNPPATRLSVSEKNSARYIAKEFFRRALKNHRGRRVVAQAIRVFPSLERWIDDRIQEAIVARANSALPQLAGDWDSKVRDAAAAAQAMFGQLDVIGIGLDRL